jgi:hypothetical protein
VLTSVGALVVLLASTGCGEGSSESATAQFEPPRTMRAQQAGSSSGSAADVSIDVLTLVDSRRISRTVFEYDFEVTVRNDGPAQDEIFVQLTATGAGTTIADAAALVGPMPAGASITPTDRIRIRHDRTLPFQGGQLQWKIDRTVGRITGTVATGAATVFGTIHAFDQLLKNACAEESLKPDASGAFSCQVLGSTTSLIRWLYEDPQGALPPMASLTKEVPGPGNTVVSNITPQTTVILGLSLTGGLSDILEQPFVFDPAKLSTVTNNFVAQHGDLRASMGLPRNYSPFTTQFAAATSSQRGDAQDNILDLVLYQRINKNFLAIPALGGRVPVDIPGTAPGSQVPPMTIDEIAFLDLIGVWSQDMKQCLASPDRVTGVDPYPPAQGGDEVRLGPKCSSLFHDNFVHNGYRAGQFTREIMTDPSSASADVRQTTLEVIGSELSALVKLILKDKFAQTFWTSFGGLGSSSGHLVAVGNGQPLDAYVRPVARRIDQYASGAGVQPSTFQSGLQVFVNRQGPNSTNLRACRVTGAGLPTAGLVLVQTASGSALTIGRTDGLTDPGFTPAAANVGNVFFLQHTAGVEGPAADTALANPASPIWAQPSHFGFAGGTSSEVFVPWGDLGRRGHYTAQCYYGSDLQPTHTFSMFRPTPVEKATALVTRTWSALDSDSRRYFDPNDALGATAQQQVTLGWLDHPLAKKVNAASFSSTVGASNVFAAVAVAPATTSAIIAAPQGQMFHALTANGNERRVAQRIFQAWDIDYQDQVSLFR